MGRSFRSWLRASRFAFIVAIAGFAGCSSDPDTGTNEGHETALTFSQSRIAQADIDRGLFTAAQLNDIGDFLFNHVYTVDEGLGNALSPPLAGPQPRPNARR